MMWDCVKVKVQSQNAPVAAHRLSLSQLEDEHGKSSLNQLQDAILSSASQDGGLDLQLTLSYLDTEGDLVPLTSQDEWENAIQERNDSQQNNNSHSKALLIFAQVLEPPKVVSTPSSPSKNGRSSPSHDKSDKLEQRLARMEDMLLKVTSGVQLSADTDSNNGRLSPQPAINRGMTPSRSGSKDYSALVMDQKAKLAARLSKVKQMNSTPSATTTRTPSPTPIVSTTNSATAATAATTGNDNENEDDTVVSSSSATSATTTNILPQDNNMQARLDRLVQVRQQDMQLLKEARVLEVQEWSRAQEKMQTNIQHSLDQHQSKLETTLKQHKREVTEVVNDRLGKMEQNRLVAQARDSVEATDVLEKTTKSLTTSIQDHLRQWEGALQEQQSNYKFANDASSSSTASLELAVKELSTKVQDRLLHLEQSNLQLQQPPSFTSNANAASPSTSNGDSNINTKELARVLTTMVGDRLNSMQHKLDTAMQLRTDDLAKKIQSQNSQQTSLQQPRIATGSANTNNSITESEVATSQALAAVVDDRLAVFQRHVDQALQQMTDLTASSSIIGGTSSTSDVAEVTKHIKKSQETILANQKQYASALRQTVIRLHEETRNHVATKADTTGPATGSSETSDWEDAKEVILASHDELRESHEENMAEQKNYLVECIELSQQSILNKLTTMDINNAGVEERVAADVERIQVQATAAILDRVDQAMARRQRWSSSADNDGGEVTARSVLSGSNGESATGKGFVGEEMEELVLGAMEKLEEAMVANCEEIQAQATAAMLDKVETSQKTIEDKVDHSNGVILNKMIKSQSILVETTGMGHAAVVDTLENNQVVIKGKLGASHSILQLLQSRAEDEQQSVQQTLEQLPMEDHGRRGHPVHQIPPPNDLDGSRHGDLRIRYDLDRSKNSQARRSSQARQRNDMDDSRKSLHSVRELPRPPSPPRTAFAQQMTGKPKVGNFLVQRFLDMDTRSLKLEHAYDCIKFNRPLSEEVTRASFAHGDLEENEGATKAALQVDSTEQSDNDGGSRDWI